MPKLLVFLLRNALIGFALAGTVVGAMILFDVGGLATIAGRSPLGGMAIALLAFFLGLTFASVQMGAAVMLLPRDGEDEGGGKRNPRATPRLALATVGRRQRGR